MDKLGVDIQLIFGNCLDKMKEIPEKSIDMILCDLPYGQLNKHNEHALWDRTIPLELLWKQYNRIIKDKGVIALFAQGMFTATLMKSNPQIWRYNLVWDKCLKTGFLNANKMPLRQHEDICIFYKTLPIYNPQKKKCDPLKRNHSKGRLFNAQTNSCYGDFVASPTVISDYKFPTSIITIPKEHINGQMYHPTQKPVALMEYLIRTYTNEGGIVLDNCMGSGSTGVACVNTSRRFIGIEIEEKYFKIAQKRIKDIKERTTNLNYNKDFLK